MDIVDKDRTVRRLAADDDWCSPVNRATSHIAKALLEAGHPAHRVYDAIVAMNEALED